MITTTAAVTPPRVPQRPVLETSSVQEVGMVATETLNLSFQDEAGRAYQLTVEKETSVYALTYDRQARVASPGRHGRGLAQGHRKRGTQDLRHLQRALQDMDLTVAGFQKLLHRFLKATDPRYADHYRGSDPVEARTRAVESDHAEFLAVNQTVRVTLSMPEEVPSDYWSVETTAGRLRDFAISLFAGGDRPAHAAEMARGMEQGYEEAQRAFGGTLPEVSRRTVDLAQELLAQWGSQDGEGLEAPVPALDLVA